MQRTGKADQEEMRMATIVVLDDVFDAGILIKRILERQGHQVWAFTEEEDAIRHIADHGADLAILDIKLKKMTGIDVVIEMKKSLPSLKTILLTGYPTLETAREALRLNVNEYCVKPIDKEELEAKVFQILNQGQGND